MLDDDGRPMRRSPRNARPRPPERVITYPSTVPSIPVLARILWPDGAHIVPGRVIAYTRREALVEWWPRPTRRDTRMTWLPRSDVVGELHLVDEHGRGRDG